jgi:hypothetical protein
MFKKYQKRIVLFLLFIFPLICFLILSTGENNFTKLDVISENVTDIATVSSVNQIAFKDHVSVVCFLGNAVKESQPGILSLNEKIYKKFLDYKQFQIVGIYADGKEAEIQELKEKLGKFTDMQNWKFVALTETETNKLYQSFSVKEPLENFSSTKAFIVDRTVNLRGRLNDEDEKNGLLYGYNLNSVSELNDKLKDDLKVLYYEYYAAFKEKNKNKADRKEVGL